MDELWTKSMPLRDHPSGPSRRASSESLSEPVSPDITSSQVSLESPQPVAGTEEDPFYVFGLSPHFNVDEETLRASYFRLCREAVQDASRLSQLHRLYQALINPCQRFDVTCRVLGLSLPPPIDELPEDILALSEALLDPTDRTKESVRQLINEKRKCLEQDIQQAFAKVDKQQLSQLRLRLGYLWRMAQMAPVGTDS